MIDYTLDTSRSILVMRPRGAVEEGDFDRLAQAVDPFIERTGCLAGIIVDAPAFPGWKAFGTLANHSRFVRKHRRHIKKVALVTDSTLGNVAEHLASDFASAEIRPFAANELASAREWITEH